MKPAMNWTWAWATPSSNGHPSQMSYFLAKWKSEVDILFVASNLISAVSYRRPSATLLPRCELRQRSLDLILLQIFWECHWLQRCSLWLWDILWSIQALAGDSTEMAIGLRNTWEEFGYASNSGRPKTINISNYTVNAMYTLYIYAYQLDIIWYN